MGDIKIHDRHFKPYLSGSEIDKAVEKVAASIREELSEKNPLFLVILNGAFIFAADLIRRMDFPCQISFVKLSSYVGTKTTAQVHQLIGLNEDLRGRTVVVVEDIVDTGLTLARLREQVLEHVPAELKIAALLFKPHSFMENFDLDYVGLEIPDDFIVGYGLDYNGYGRNLPEIYQICS